MDFRGKTAIITGGTGALGNVVAAHFFTAGATIAIPFRQTSSANLLPKEIRDSTDRVWMGKADISVEQQVIQFVSDVKAKFHAIDFLVNIAGGYAGGSAIADVSLDEWERMMNLNLKTAFLMSREVLKEMKQQNAGRIVNIAAMPAITGGANKGPYAISKRGVITLTETIAAEVKAKGITANAIAPGIILTEENRRSMPDADFSRWVTPEEVAEMILFLCSESARSLNGNTIRMFGVM
ncbi:MAG: SDR family oxidoreductase [Bacteroidetes bacterium]|nr:SDR family oxidoreductase [Bacteroidota bacterium]MCW5896313.1 SDR family oxidoreductase [Bacteroidota bacterium]